MKSPWHDLPTDPPFVLPIDQASAREFNELAGALRHGRGHRREIVREAGTIAVEELRRGRAGRRTVPTAVAPA